MQLGTTTSRLHFCTGSTVHRSPSPHPTSGNATSFPRFPICRGVSLHRLAVLRDAKGVFTSSLSRELSCMILRAVAGVRSRMHVHNTLFQRPDACQSSPCVRALCMAELRRHMSPRGGGGVCRIMSSKRKPHIISTHARVLMRSIALVVGSRIGEPRCTHKLHRSRFRQWSTLSSHVFARIRFPISYKSLRYAPACPSLLALPKTTPHIYIYPYTDI